MVGQVGELMSLLAGASQAAKVEANRHNAHKHNIMSYSDESQDS